MSAGAERTAGRSERAVNWRSLALDLLALLGLALAVLTILWPLGLTNRVLAGLDAYTYFEPYWAYRNAALSTGTVPLWNPYLFLGVPFLANPQAAVLYPLHWLLVSMPAERALVWSALLHVWLAAVLTYVLLRRSYRTTRPAAWLGGLLFGLGGFSLSRVENINQLNALAWLPAMFWLYDETVRAADWRRGLRWGAALTTAIALEFLAGHTQTTYVNLFGLGLYALYRPVVRTGARLLRNFSLRSRRRAGLSDDEPLPLGKHGPGRPATVHPWRRAWLPLLAVLPAVLLVSAQLLPSLELNALGLRTGGLDFRQAVSFSLRPRLLLQSLLPPFGGRLAETFASEGYAEFVAYVGITGIVLALCAVIGRVRPGAGSKLPTDTAGERALGEPLVLAGTGLFLALGAYNPFYYLLWRLAPGFSSFRAPVRWLELTAMGLAVLAALGLDRVGQRNATSQDVAPGAASSRRLPGGRIAWIVAGALLLPTAALLAYQQWPAIRTVVLWAGAAVLAGAAVWAGWLRRRAARTGLIALAVLELWLGSRALPFTLATAPYAYSMRNAPAALLAKVADQPAAGRDRFLSMSDIRYDPGDLAEMRELMAGSLSIDAIERLVRSAKLTEVIAPNVSLRLALPALDGYDGGLLPTQDYGDLQTLFLKDGQILPDGRLREQLRQIPPERLLDLTGVRFVITDKQNDLWADNVYYDLEQEAVVEPGQTLELSLTDYPRFQATALGVVSRIDSGAADGSVAAQIEVNSDDDRTTTISLRSGSETAPGQGPEGNARLARTWSMGDGSQGQDYLSRLELGAPQTPATITVQVPSEAQSPLHLVGLSLIDERTGAHESVTVSQADDYRRIQSGDVKIYERMLAPGRAWIAHGVQPAADRNEALSFLNDPSFDPRATVVVEGAPPPAPPAEASDGEQVIVSEFEPERIRLEATLTESGTLVVSDAYYPGWQATVDGVQAPLLRSNLMFRGIALEPGRHEILLTYKPASWHWGVLASAFGLVLVLTGLLATGIPARRVARSQV